MNMSNIPTEIILLRIQEKYLIRGKQSRQVYYKVNRVHCHLTYAYIYTNDHMLLYHKGTVTLKPKPATDYHIER